ncbi:MAG: hypothetical protein AAGK47_10190 [Bacteroidota bacterium]
MQRVSTNLTLAYKFFFPIIWITFFGCITLFCWLTDVGYVGNIPMSTFRIVMLASWGGGVILFYLAFLQLKRVEMDDTHVYVSNYFKTVRYPYEDVDKITSNNFLLFKSANIYLKGKGMFGKKIVFVPSKRLFESFTASRPKLFEYLLRED